MIPEIAPVKTSVEFPASTEIVIIGGGIVGLSAALTLSERGVSVVLLEKGQLAAEQSSRNQGWIRKTSRSAADLPMSIEADRLWAEMPQRVGQSVGYAQTGVMFLAETEAEMAGHQTWLKSVEGMGLDSVLLTPKQISEKIPGGKGDWAGAIYTASDGCAEPSLAASAIAKAALAKGATIVENCAVRTLSMSGGRINGVVTERGEIACEQVLLAGGLWSRRFLLNHGVNLPTLPLALSVVRTAPMDGPTDIAVGGPDFSFRKRHDGGYTITQRGAVNSPIVLDHLLLGHRFLPVLKHQRHLLRISLGKAFIDDLKLSRRWKATDSSPFENVRVMDPEVDHGINDEAMQNVRAAWPIFEKAEITQTWAGMMDVTPDSLPVIGPVESMPGLILATGFSGHGFGTGPAAGELAADILMGTKPLVEPSPYSFDRF